MTFQKTKNNKGFVILFAVTLSSILLAIALGVADVALKEINFSTSAKDTNNAFFAADTGVEYTLFNDKPPSSQYPTDSGKKKTWSFFITGLGSDGRSCAIVSITKDNTAPPNTTTTIVSKGYNIGDVSCAWSGAVARIERELDINY